MHHVKRLILYMTYLKKLVWNSLFKKYFNDKIPNSHVFSHENLVKKWLFIEKNFFALFLMLIKKKVFLALSETFWWILHLKNFHRWCKNFFFRIFNIKFVIFTKSYINSQNFKKICPHPKLTFMAKSTLL